MRRSAVETGLFGKPALLIFESLTDLWIWPVDFGPIYDMTGTRHEPLQVKHQINI